ncbi:hypothetical protein AOLI_G00013150 [Acnodon oligacanthus]
MGVLSRSTLSAAAFKVERERTSTSAPAPRSDATHLADGPPHARAPPPGSLMSPGRHRSRCLDAPSPVVLSARRNSCVQRARAPPPLTVSRADLAVTVTPFPRAARRIPARESALAAHVAAVTPTLLERSKKAPGVSCWSLMVG